MGRYLLAGLFVLLLVVPGCGPKTRPEALKYPVSGTVTLDGKPLPDGEVYFRTVATGARDVLTVKDGKFAGRAEAGERRVEVYAYKQAPPNPMYKDSPNPPPATKENYIPSKYNTDTQIPVAQVSSGGPNQFSFAITSQ